LGSFLSLLSCFCSRYLFRISVLAYVLLSLFISDHVVFGVDRHGVCFAAISPKMTDPGAAILSNNTSFVADVCVKPFKRGFPVGPPSWGPVEEVDRGLDHFWPKILRQMSANYHGPVFILHNTP
jgi:hypothetical protein